MPENTPGENSRGSSPGALHPEKEEINVLEVGTIETFQNAMLLETWRHRADTARRLAYFLITLLTVSFLCHFTAAVVLVVRGNHEGAAVLKDVFTLWLPVIAALTSSAVTYYFTKQQ